MTYRINHLSLVIFRIDFSPILLLQGSLKPEYQESLRSQFPNFDSKDSFEHTVILGGASDEKREERLTCKLWEFSNLEKTIKITTRYNWFAVECLKYVSFQKFEDSVKTAFTNFKRFYEPIVCKRIGLRYINSIKIPEGDPFKWAEYLSSFLANPIEEFPSKESLVRAMSQYTVAKDDCRIIINSGMPNREYPNKIGRKEFTLDFDCASDDCESKEPLSSLRIFHDEIENLFEKCITNKLRSLMGVNHEEG